MRRVATPGEVAAWQRQFEALPQYMHDRIPAMIGMVAEVVAACAYCDEPIRRCDRRGEVHGRLAHLRCAAPRQLDDGQHAPVARREVA